MDMDMARGRLPPVIIIMVMDMVDMAMDTDMERGKLMLPLATIIMVMVMDMDMDTDMERGRLRLPLATIIMVMDMVDMAMDMDMEKGKPPLAIIIMVMVDMVMDMVMDTMVKQYLFIIFSKFCCIHWNLLESSQQKHRPLFKKNRNSFFEIKR